MKPLLRAFAATFALLALTTRAAEPPTKFGTLARGDAVPGFTVIGADGKELALAAFRGRVLVVSFGATNRPPADALENLAAKYAGDGVAVLGVCAAPARADFDAWAAKNRGTASYPLTWDPAGAAMMERIARKNFGVGVTPATVVIDRTGRFVGGFVGFGAVSGSLLNGLLHDAGVAVPAAELPPPLAPRSDDTLLKPGAPAPDFTAIDPEGRAVKLADFRGKIVVLDFWATWCGPCIASMPHTQRVAAATKSRGVIVLASCTNDPRANFEKWVRQNAATYPDLRFSHDPAEWKEDFASKKLYGVNGIPTQFLIDRDGRIAEVFVGYGEGDTRLEDALRKLGVDVSAEK